MSPTGLPQSSPGSAPGNSPLNRALLEGARSGNVAAVQDALKKGASISASDEQTGLTALHLAVGTNNLILTKVLVEEWKAPFGPDGFGRWPTVVAAQCHVSEELSDYVFEKEAAATAAPK